jgi:hypothetical protein
MKPSMALAAVNSPNVELAFALRIFSGCFARLLSAASALNAIKPSITNASDSRLEIK